MITPRRDIFTGTATGSDGAGHTVPRQERGTVSINEILSRLRGVKARSDGRNWDCLCPAHEDRHPSLSVGLGDDGRILLKCQRGCATSAVVAALGLQLSQLQPANGEDQGSRIEALYDYRDEAGCLLYQVVRLYPKSFYQRRPRKIPARNDVAGDWVNNLGGVTRVLYRLPELCQASRDEIVWVVEGEKDCDNLRTLGLVATTNCGGAGKWRAEYNQSLAGRKVVVIPDRDKPDPVTGKRPGLDHARTVAEALRGVAASVRILELPEVEGVKDVTDWLQQGGTKEQLLALLERVPASPADEEPDISPMPWPEPPCEEAFHGIAGEIVDAIDPETEADRVAILAQFLAFFGNACGRYVYRTVGAKRHYPNLFTVLVGRTAKGRKGTSLSWVESLFEAACPEWFRDRVQTGLSSGEGLIYAVRDEVIRSVNGVEQVVDEGVSDKRLLVIEEEFASVMRLAARDGNILSMIIRRAFDGAKLQTLTKRDPNKSTNSHISIIGHITREELASCLSETEQRNGFANRFLWLAVKRSKLLPDGGSPLDLSEFHPRIREALRVASFDARMERTLAARDLWHQAYVELSSERPGPLGLITSRAEAIVLRLALIYALLDCSEEIDVRHLNAALALWDYSVRSCQWVFGESTGSADADKLLEAVRSAGPAGLSGREIDAVFSKNKTAGQLRKIVNHLVEFGLVAIREQATGGRPKQVLFCPGMYGQNGQSGQSGQSPETTGKNGVP